MLFVVVYNVCMRAAVLLMIHLFVCRSIIQDALKAAGFLFVSLSEGDLEQVVMAMSERTLAVGQTIIRQGNLAYHSQPCLCAESTS